MVLAAIAYFQPVTRRELGNLIGREVSRDTLADLRSFGLIANGPKKPEGRVAEHLRDDRRVSEPVQP
jgi:segregation and condensation protein B